MTGAACWDDMIQIMLCVVAFAAYVRARTGQSSSGGPAARQRAGAE